MSKIKKKNTLVLPLIFLCISIIVFLSLIYKFLYFSRPTNPPSLSNPSNSTNPSLLPSFSFKNIINSKNKKEISLLAVGDIMLGRYVNVKMLSYNDFKYPFLKTADFTAQADLSFANLEAPIIADCKTTESGMVFCAKPEAIAGLKFGGFDVLSVANNHALNQGPDGLTQTKILLEKNGIAYSDSNKLTVKIIAGTKIGFIAFDLVTYPQTPVVEKVKENVSKVDVLIVSLHWGAEYQKNPSFQQKELAHQLIDAGVKVIIGHHPHVTQPEETYNKGLIFYSLGNFIFDQPWSEETKKGNIAKIIFEGKNVKSYQIVPVYIEDYCQPNLVKP